MTHGTLTEYIREGCRCGECRKHRSRWQKRYRLDYDRGQRRTTSAAQARRHLQHLLDAGMSEWGITVAGGWKSRNSWYRIVRGETQRIMHATEARILAIQPEHDVRDMAYVASERPSQRLRSLQANGWPYRDLAHMLDMNASSVLKQLSGSTPTMRRETAERIDTLFERLWDKPGPSQRSRTAARRKGWPMPMDLEDADAEITGCATCEDILHLCASGEELHHAAARLGMRSNDSVRQHLKRHGVEVPLTWRWDA